jgi:hypothetical protein
MDYEKAYKEALNWMRGIYPTLAGSDKEDAEHYFPELKESDKQKPAEWRDRLKDEIKHLKIDVYDEAHQFDLGARSSLTFLESFIDTLTEK